MKDRFLSTQVQTTNWRKTLPTPKSAKASAIGCEDYGSLSWDCCCCCCCWAALIQIRVPSWTTITATLRLVACQDCVPCLSASFVHFVTVLLASQRIAIFTGQEARKDSFVQVSRIHIFFSLSFFLLLLHAVVDVDDGGKNFTVIRDDEAGGGDDVAVPVARQVIRIPALRSKVTLKKKSFFPSFRRLTCPCNKSHVTYGTSLTLHEWKWANRKKNLDLCGGNSIANDHIQCHQGLVTLVFFRLKLDTPSSLDLRSNNIRHYVTA